MPEVNDIVTIETNGPFYILGYYGIITDIDDTMISLNCTSSWKEKPLGSREDFRFDIYNVSIGKNSITKLTWEKGPLVTYSS